MNKNFLNNDGKGKHLDSIKKHIDFIENEFPKTIKDRIFFSIGLSLENSLQLVDECETPIEYLLADAIRKELDYFNGRTVFNYFLHPQEKIIKGDQHYRVDFLLAPIQLENDTYFPNFLIECDGHEFHEKTKEQAAKDKQRERDLQSLGYIVIRFTGSEIVANPDKCAREVLSIVRQIEIQGNYGDKDG